VIRNRKKTIPLNLSQDEINIVSGGVCYNSLNAFTSMSVDLIGSERTLELAVPQAKELGVKVGKNLMGNSGGNGSIQTIREKLEVLHSIQGHTGTTVQSTNSGLEREVKECPCKGSLPEVCMQFEAISNGVFEAINPDYEFSYDRMMSKGDRTCHWVVRKKFMEARPQDSIQDDSLGY
jgi:predicted hydrocarbon binding protein